MQRILVTIPHFFDRSGDAEAQHDSARAGSAAVRARALRTVILSLHELFAESYLLADHVQQQCISATALDRMQLDICVIVNGDNHLLDQLDCPAHLYHRIPGIGDPQWLGLAAHKLIAQMQGRYDWYCYLEDDTAIEDPLFFNKLRYAYDALASAVGPDAILQPYRYETARDAGPVQTGARKLYPDWDSGGVDFQAPSVRVEALGRAWTFMPARHPHAGCFFLDQSRAALFSQSPYCGEPKEVWITPPDTAATLALMRTFRIFKAAPDSLPFLEVRHLRPAMIGNLKPGSADTYRWR
jgi:hypothetical protein